MNNYGYYPFHQGMPMQPGQMMPDGDRIFLAPFLLGGLGGAALVGLSRPRPVYVTGGQHTIHIHLDLMAVADTVITTTISSYF